MKNECIVFYESWQMECCGIAFSTGDIIKWPVYETDHLNTPVDVGKIDYCYEAHSSDWNGIFVLEGKVNQIKILYEKYMPSKDNSQLLVPFDGKMIDTDRAEGFDKKVDEMQASGYVVSICNYVVRQAEKSAETFL